MSRSKHNFQLISDQHPNSPLSLAFKQLRTNIEFSKIDKDIKTILVTSTKVGEGKSTTSANLAIAFAQTGKKVLLLDADLREPSQHLIFQTSNSGGVTLLLSQQITLKEAVLPTGVENLYLVPSGPIPASSTEMIRSERMSLLLEELKLVYDVIIIDSPPVLASSDAQIMAVQSDGVMMVVNSGKVKKEALIKAKSHLDMVKARILGAVLNNIELKKVSSYLYG